MEAGSDLCPLSLAGTRPLYFQLLRTRHGFRRHGLSANEKYPGQ